MEEILYGTLRKINIPSVQSPRFQCLPTNRENPLWNGFMDEAYNLSIVELDVFFIIITYFKWKDE
jgi:hypothetical protein